MTRRTELLLVGMTFLVLSPLSARLRGGDDEELQKLTFDYWSAQWDKDLLGDERYELQRSIAQGIVDLGEERGDDTVVARGLCRLALADQVWFWNQNDGTWEDDLARAERLCGEGIAKAEVLAVRGYLRGFWSKRGAAGEKARKQALLELSEAEEIASRSQNDLLLSKIYFYMAEVRRVGGDYGMALYWGHASLASASSLNPKNDASRLTAVRCIWRLRRKLLPPPLLAIPDDPFQLELEKHGGYLADPYHLSRMIRTADGEVVGNPPSARIQRLNSFIESYSGSFDSQSKNVVAYAKYMLGLHLLYRSSEEEGNAGGSQELSMAPEALEAARLEIEAAFKTWEELDSPFLERRRLSWAYRLVELGKSSELDLEVLEAAAESDPSSGNFVLLADVYSRINRNRPSEDYAKRTVALRAAAKQVGYERTAQLVREYADLGDEAWKTKIKQRRLQDESVAAETKFARFQLLAVCAAGVLVGGFFAWRYRENARAYKRLNEEVAARELEQKRSEELQSQVIASQRLESIGTLAAGIAHDVNNALAAIVGFTEIARVEKDFESRDQSLAMALDASQLAASTTRDLLTFARETQSRMQPVDLVALVAEAGSFMRRILPASIDFKCDFDASQTLYCNSDRARLMQVLINLVRNAKDAVSDHGAIRIALTTAEEKPDHAKIEVTDDGIGMTADELSHIFEPFYTTKGRSQGTGLGLAVVHGVIEGHQGEIRAESAKGNGTTITVFLPTTSSSEIPAETQLNKVHGNSRLILVAEDDEWTRRVIAAHLENAGFRVQSCRDGQEALAYYSEHEKETAAVVLDCDLPLLDGPSALDRIRQLNPEVPALLISGWAARSAVKKASFLAKPFGGEELGHAIWKILDSGEKTQGVADPAS